MMFDLPFQVAIAGHICLDIIPAFGPRANQAETLLAPGKLVTVGPAVTATGGAVSNVGLALHRLGVPVRLMGKVGDDLFGRAVLDALRRRDALLTEGMIVAVGESTSYSVVINEPGRDRIFLHSPGANNTFAAADVAAGALEGLGLLHFGYPPLMRRMYADGGRELADLLRRAKACGVTTTLDMAWPDPNSEAGQVDWPHFLERVLPHVDCFLPSLEEMVAMLDRPLLDAAGLSEDHRAAQVEGSLLSALGERLLGLGIAIVALKLGDQGFYLRTTADAARLEAMGACGPANAAAWCGRELLVPCFQVEMAGTTGAGDCTIAGFLAGLLAGMKPEAVVTSAVAVGACSVEQVDATTGIPDWATVQSRIGSGWERRPVALPLPGWQWDEAYSLWRGPHDTPSE